MLKAFGRLIAVSSLIVGFGVAVPAPAQASAIDCLSFAYECTPGYTADNTQGTWAWAHYGNIPGNNIGSATGNHNCTLYAAWRLQQSGMPNPANWGNASNWASAIGGGNHTPTVGSIAWYAGTASNSTGHVAYVEQVSGATVYIRADNYSTTSGYTDAGWVAASSVDLFLHPHDAAAVGGAMWFIKSHNPGSGHVEVHSATAASGYTAGAHIATWFSPADADNGWFQMAGSDLYFVKTKHTGSGRVEVHSAAASQSYHDGVHAASAFSIGDADNGWFQMAGGDLYFIKTKHTGTGRVELFRASASSGFSQVVAATPTAFSPGDAGNGWFQIQAGDLVFIKTKHTGSGQVEYFRASAGSNFNQVVTATPTAFSPGDADNGWFSSEDVNGDGTADLVFIKTHSPGSGHVEFFVADGAKVYQQVTSANITWLSPADANNGVFLADSEQ